MKELNERGELKLLMITQRVDPEDSVVGFAYVWINELRKHLKKVIVLCLKRSERVAIEGVEIYEIKKRGGGRVAVFLNFVKYCWRAVFNEKVNGILVHQCPIYVLLVYPIAKLKGVPIILWYAHSHVSLSLLIANSLVKIILTSTKEGCRIRSKKVKVIGQGIDIEKFSPHQKSAPEVDLEGVRVGRRTIESVEEGVVKLEEETYKYQKRLLLSVGRISPVKDYFTIIKAMNYLIKEKGLTNAELMIVGEPFEYKDRKYLEELKEEVLRLGLNNHIKFVGAVSYDKMNKLYYKGDIIISASRTGSLDKVILEAMASGKLVLTSLPIDDVLGVYASILKYAIGNHIELAEKIYNLLNIDRKREREICEYLRMVVIKEHSLSRFIDRVIGEFKNINH